MDIFGNVCREYERLAHANHVKQAFALAETYKEDGLNREQIEEMLYASDYEANVVQEAMSLLPGGK